MTNREIFLARAREEISRPGLGDLLDWLDKSDFFTTPASTRFHGSHEGGLCEHSLAVHDRIKVMNNAYMFMAVEGDPITSQAPVNESLAIVALFHDICKVGSYKTEMRWRKDAKNKWEQYPTYKFDEDFSFGGHGSKSMYLIMNFMKLTPDEATAINCHMGAWDQSQYSNPSPAYEKCPLAWILHVADEAATYIDKT